MSEYFSLIMQSTNNSVGATQTWNGAFSNDSSGEDLTNLFYSSCRGIDRSRFEELLNASWIASPLYTLKCIAYIRDIRGGKGERQLGRWALEWLSSKSPSDLERNIKSYVDQYGRWDDLLSLVTLNKDLVCSTFKAQLVADLESLGGNKSISLCAKWVPSEGKSVDKKTHIFKHIAAAMEISNSDLRHQLTSLRKKIDLVESHLCDMTLEQVNYSHVPSKCMHIHSKPKNAFIRRDEARFNEYKQALVKGEAKINASTLFPHEIVNSTYNSQDDAIIDAQWHCMIEKLSAEEKHHLSKTMAVVDVSGSMMNGTSSARPIDVAIAIGLLVSEMNPNSALKNKILTFSSNPRFHSVTGTTLRARCQSINHSDWAMSTDFIKAFRLILDTAKQHKLTQENLPDTLIVISDMQFNSGTNENEYLSNYEILYKEYEQAGYKVPKLVFWNVNGSTKDYPVVAGNTNTALVSGFSIDILKDVLAGEDVTPLKTAIRTLSKERYASIVRA